MIWSKVDERGGKALEHMAAVHGSHPQLLRAVMDINRDQRLHVVQKLRDLLGSLSDKQIGILGLSFKPSTDDIRESPALAVIHLLQHEGAVVRAYDPVAMDNARKALPEVEYCEDAYEVARGSDALVVVTDWNEVKHLHLATTKESMRRPVLIDGRNIYDIDTMKELGFIYRGIGRGYGVQQ